MLTRNDCSSNRKRKWSSDSKYHFLATKFDERGRGGQVGNVWSSNINLELNVEVVFGTRSAIFLQQNRTKVGGVDGLQMFKV